MSYTAVKDLNKAQNWNVLNAASEFYYHHWTILSVMYNAHFEHKSTVISYQYKHKQ